MWVASERIGPDRRIFLGERSRDFRDHRPHVSHRYFALSRHHRGVGQHVAVVRGIDREQTGGRPHDFAKGPIGRHRPHVGLDCLLPAAPANIDVRRHVNVVRQARLQGTQMVRCGVRALRMRRSFDRVNVKMLREGMFRIQFQDRIERCQDFIRARVRLAFQRPLVSRA
jgi:hypothetical protein